MSCSMGKRGKRRGGGEQDPEPQRLPHHCTRRGGTACAGRPPEVELQTVLSPLPRGGSSQESSTGDFAKSGNQALQSAQICGCAVIRTNSQGEAFLHHSRCMSVWPQIIKQNGVSRSSRAAVHRQNGQPRIHRTTHSTSACIHGFQSRMRENKDTGSRGKSSAEHCRLAPLWRAKESYICT